jgi:hypothetical protein
MRKLLRSTVFMGDFGHIKSYLKCNLFKQYCCTFYGAPLLSLNNYHQLNVEWRKALRQVWRLPCTTHSHIITQLSDVMPMFFGLINRFCKFSSNLLSFGFIFIKTVFNRAISNPFSVFQYNLIELKSKYGDNFIDNS